MLLAGGGDGTISTAAEIAFRTGVVLAVLPGSTRSTAVFFSNFGVAYTARLVDVPASTGYGEPVQKLFKLRDGERIVAALSLDPRAAGQIAPVPKKGGAIPEDLQTTEVVVGPDGIRIGALLKQIALAPSTSEAMRKINERAVRVDGSVVEDRERVLHAGGEHLVQLGKRGMARVRLVAQ